jgi:hypothetical protein
MNTYKIKDGDELSLRIISTNDSRYVIDNKYPNNLFPPKFIKLSSDSNIKLQKFNDPLILLDEKIYLNKLYKKKLNNVYFIIHAKV